MRITHRHVAIALALSAVIGCGAAPKSEIAPRPEAASQTTESGERGLVVYVVRHAEKLVAAENPKDPPLTDGGAQRAAALAEAIDTESLVAVYSTAYARTKSTAAPCAEAAGLPVTEYPPDDTAGLVAKIKSTAKGGVLVVGHSNTVPEILKALGVPEPVVLGEGDFGDLFVVTLHPDGAAAMEHRRFGD
jgi:phosphohistidine phosphatase SixA